MMRTDDHNNPTAMTTAVALLGGLILGTDFEIGEPFDVAGFEFHTARLIGNPLNLTIKVIDKIGFITKGGSPRWEYIRFPHFVWLSFEQSTKVDVIGWMYEHEGGSLMRALFPNYGKQ